MKELFTALAGLQAQIKSVHKDSNNPFFKSKYADLDSCWEALRIPLKMHGLSVIQLPHFEGGEDMLITMLCHSSGESVQSKMRLHLVKKDPQAMGSAITYARRYALCAITGLTQTDDDGNLASGKNSNETTPNLGGSGNFGIHPSIPHANDGNSNPTHYTIPFGKYKQRSLEEVGADALRSYIEYLEIKAKKDKKEITGQVADFITRASEYVGSFENIDISEFLNK